MDQLTSEEIKDYQSMIEKQKSKPILEDKKNNAKNIITEAYIHSLCLERKVSLKEPIRVSDKTKNKIYELYLSGVLPLRLGGVNL
jgi:coproporphyrinogen III oxidase-like Fe-S oxidoreductase